MSKSDHNSRRHPARHDAISRRSRGFRRSLNRMARNWDDAKPFPTGKTLTRSACGHECCW